jgi:hypothetical protein
MKLVAEYRKQAVQFERMAEETDDPNLKGQLLEHAAAYKGDICTAANSIPKGAAKQRCSSLKNHPPWQR